MDNCPICNRPLINGCDEKQQIEYTEENLAKFTAGEISLAELNETARIYYTRIRLCDNKGNDETIEDKNGIHKVNPPCPNYYGIRGGTIDKPDIIVKTIKIYDN
jgi:hypothetical protein